MGQGCTYPTFLFGGMIKDTFKGVLACDQRLSGYERILHVFRREAVICHLYGAGQEARISQGE